MKWVFDLDGTLVETREAVRQAYLGAGVHMPEDAWGKPWREWLDDELKHRRKNELYPIMLQQFGSRTGLLQLLIQQRRPLNIITGASMDAVIALQNCKLLPRCVVHLTQCNATRKVDWLARHGWGTYVDDDAVTRLLVKEHTTWQVLTPEEALAVLSSPPARMSG